MNSPTNEVTYTRRVPALCGALAIAAAACLIGLTACNTVEGAGRDIEAAGDAIEDTASDAKD